MMMYRKNIHGVSKKLKQFSQRLLSSSSSNNNSSLSKDLPSIPISKRFPTHIIFGANTDVGKTVLSTTLVRSSILNNETVNYIKPLQCGGGDEAFIHKYVNDMTKCNNEVDTFKGHTLHQWDMPASPHLASRVENKPVSDEQVLFSLQSKLNDIHQQSKDGSIIWIESAGGVLSPSSSSPSNQHPRHASSDGELSNSNSWGWSTQGDLYQPLHLPVILVGDGRLGGISATLSALESLLTRGYDVHAIALIEDSSDVSGHGSNLPALKEYASRCMSVRSGSGRVLFGDIDKSIVSFPALPSDTAMPLNDWFDTDQVIEGSTQLRSHLRNEWINHVNVLKELRSKGTNVLWWPFTQHQGHNNGKVKATLIDGASGDNFSIVHDGEDSLIRTNHFDACSSWWTQGMGHGESSLALTAAAAAGRYGHVIFPDVVHEPATTLADILVNSNIGPGKGWASRVFFTDDGSTAVEVAIKMGMKKFAHDRKIDLSSNEDLILTVCAQQDCYHGDTLGVMDVAEPSIFNEGQHPWYEPKGLFLTYPTVRYQDGIIGLNFSSSCYEHGLKSIEEVFDVNNRLSSELYKEYFASIENEWENYEASKKSRLVYINIIMTSKLIDVLTNLYLSPYCHYFRFIGSVIIEPLLLGAGGMKFVDPLWQRALMDVSKSKNVPVIFDEVASGLYRLGVRSCREVIKADPDIAAYAKLLTGGLLPMSVTLATEDVFQTFLGDSKAEALLHGHSYTAHPIGCVSSIHALETYNAILDGKSHGMFDYFDQREVSQLSRLSLVQESMSLGTVLAVTIKPDSDGGGGYGASSRSIPIVRNLFENGVYARPLGNVVYIMVSPLTSSEECSRMLKILRNAIESCQSS